jgi:hypothetical protein
MGSNRLFALAMAGAGASALALGENLIRPYWWLLPNFWLAVGVNAFFWWTVAKLARHR